MLGGLAALVPGAAESSLGTGRQPGAVAQAGLRLPSPGTSAAIQMRTQGAASSLGSAGGKPDVGTWIDFGVWSFSFICFSVQLGTSENTKSTMYSVSPLQAIALSSAHIRQKFCLTPVNDVQIQLCPPSLEKKCWKTHLFIYKEHRPPSGRVSHEWLCPRAFTC